MCVFKGYLFKHLSVNADCEWWDVLWPPQLHAAAAASTDQQQHCQMHTPTVYELHASY